MRHLYESSYLVGSLSLHYRTFPYHVELSCHQMTMGKIFCVKLMVENHRHKKIRKQFDILDDKEFRRQVLLSCS